MVEKKQDQVEEKREAALSAVLEENVQGLPQAVEAVGAALAERYYVRLAEQALPEDRPAEDEALELAVEAELESLRRSSRTLAQA